MNNTNKNLCLKLARSESEGEIIRTLKKADLWDDPNAGLEDFGVTGGSLPNDVKTALMAKENQKDVSLLRILLIEYFRFCTYAPMI